ncbi:MAG: NADH-quinone oxidoreductase subunit NuoG [Legionellales bacterium]|jgi:NADH-quinone oxidoreductase subunit G
MIEIEINGKKVSAQPGSMIIEVADQIDVRIPRFCYHKKLSVAANCRMCLVEVGDVRKPLPACATPVSQGMKVFTRSKLALDAQRAVMEFLLINHPLDCPVCDQGGECELQDVSVGYGRDISRFNLGKRSVKDQDIGPLIETEMTRCIHCTRCVRFGKEVAGLHELGVMNRGEHLEISTLVERTVTSELSGNMIDLCPVGALTSKPYRFTARAWELSQRPTIAAHDAVGSHIYAHVIHNQVKRVVPKECESINETWISDRDRFSYEGLYHADRILTPKVKRNNKWESVDWQTALEFAAEKLRAVKPEAIGSLVTSNATNEEFYLLQKLMRTLGSSNIDHRLQEQDFSDQEQFPDAPLMNITLDELAQADVILLVGSHVNKEQPIVAHRIRKATLNSGQVVVVNPIDYKFNFKVADKEIVTGGDLVSGLEKMLKSTIVGKAKQGIILLGAHALNHPQAASIRALAASSDLKMGFLTQGANAAGAWLMGAVPHRLAGGQAASGKNAQQMFQEKMKAFVLLGVEPEYDAQDSGVAYKALKEASCVIAMNTFQTHAMLEYADVMLPITPHAEMSGTMINGQGMEQKFSAVTDPQGESRPAWKVMRVLANLLELDGFEYQTLEDVQHEISHITLEKKSANFKGTTSKHKLAELVRISGLPIYAQDALVRRAESLQKTVDGTFTGLHINAAQAKRLGLNTEYVKAKQDDFAITAPLIIDETIPDGAVYLASGLRETAGLGAAYQAIQLEAVNHA